MWWWTRTMNGPALKDGLNFKSLFRRVQTELIRVCWYSERRPGPPCVLARIYGSSHVLRKSTLSLPPHPRFFFPLFSLSLKGADQFTASSGGVRLIPALCDWLRRHKPSVVRSRSLSPPRPISHGGQRPTLFTSGLCQPVARLRSKEITLIKPPPLLLPLSHFLLLSRGSEPISTPEIITQVTNVLALIADRPRERVRESTPRSQRLRHVFSNPNCVNRASWQIQKSSYVKTPKLDVNNKNTNSSASMCVLFY